MQRDKTIDTLRGLAMFSMMVIHACSYYFDNMITYFIWDNLQWAVPVFLFCSFYLFYTKTKEFPPLKLWPSYLKKRFTRLLIPYYVFLVALIALAVGFGMKSMTTSSYILANIFLYKGIDFNWLVLLFVYLIFLMPLILLLKKNKLLYYGYFALSLASSIYFIFYPANYRAIMWLPWSVFAYFTVFFIDNVKNKRLMISVAILSAIVFFVTQVSERNMGHNLSQYANKYPPTIYHISFGIFWIIVLWGLAKKNFFSVLRFDRLLHFLSVNSYSLYFIHVLVMYTIDWLRVKPPTWPLFFLEIIVGSSLIQLALNLLPNYGFKKRIAIR
jgi:surface polysaccharide O-acyltransferase-like enzyme